MSCCQTDHSRQHFAGRRGIALVVVLAMLVIVTLLVVSFMTVMRLDRTATQSYSQSIKAEQLGQGALQLVIGELENEMKKDAAPDLTYADHALFTNVVSTNVVPQRVGANSVLTNLVKISTNAPAFIGSLRSGNLRASSVSSSMPSRNGRFISTNRWSQVYLGNFIDNASLPYWVMATRGGTSNGAGMTFGPAAANSANNPDPANTNYVIGRFAYAIYDEGGLLNLTMAGYPNTAASAAATKGAAVWADLAQIPGIVNPDALVQWRNAATYASYTNYVTSFAATNGFGKVHPGDRTFLSRGDLIRFAKDNGNVVSTNALPYLTTFSQDLNAPVFKPTTPTGSSINYSANANDASSINRFLPNVRVTTAFTRPDGTPATPGEPLLARRFPLSRLGLITYTATAAQDSDIHKYFGLIRSNASQPWVYSNADGTPATKIKTLSEVADEGREPNFFELLQAVILDGSTGVAKGGGMLPSPTSSGGLLCTDTKHTFQLLRIGANIIDQYDADNYPTTVSFQTALGTVTDNYQVYGIEDIPYPNKILLKFITSCPDQIPASMPNWFSPMNVEIFFEMWNPHQLTPASSNAGPTAFRIKVNSDKAIYRISSQKQYTIGSDTVTENFTPPTTDGPAPPYRSIPNTIVRFDASPTADPAGLPSSFREPRVIRNQGGLSPAVDGASILSFSTTGEKALGFTLNGPAIIEGEPPAGSRLHTDPAKKGSTDPDQWSLTWPFTSINGQFISKPWWWVFEIKDTIFSYQYQDALGNWQTYATSGGLEGNEKTGLNTSGFTVSVTPRNLALTDPTQNHPYARADNMDGRPWLRSDPRSPRLGMYLGDVRNIAAPQANAIILTRYSATPSPVAGDSALINANNDILNAEGNLAPAGWTKPLRLDWMSRNKSGDTPGGGWSYSAYTDPDAVVRPGDCYLSTTNQPMKANNTETRPIVLNRPFRSVAELGYVFRDTPWKTLDLFSPNSADTGLLDVFSIEDAPATSGRVGLNTRQPEVLKALLTGVRIREATTASAAVNLSAAEAETIAKAIVAHTTTNAQIDAGGLVQALSGINVVTNTSKMEHEAALRALASSTSARTWNLLIDVIAQVGKYPPNASSIENFVVEGERRYWMHVAIDRYTGKVISKYLETPDE